MENELFSSYNLYKSTIQNRLNEFKKVAECDYFYEMCFCLLTPQSKAKNAIKAIEILKEKDFQNNPFNCASVLNNPTHYIRFHNTKAKKLLNAIHTFPVVLETIRSNPDNFEKRNKISDIVNGFGLKESSHFLRNIGFQSLAILDRHILKHLLKHQVINEIPKTLSRKIYFDIEQKFLQFANHIQIPIDELDLLFWASETGEVLK